MPTTDAYETHGDDDHDTHKETIRTTTPTKATGSILPLYTGSAICSFDQKPAMRLRRRLPRLSKNKRGRWQRGCLWRWNESSDQTRKSLPPNSAGHLPPNCKDSFPKAYGGRSNDHRRVVDRVPR